MNGFSEVTLILSNKFNYFKFTISLQGDLLANLVHNVMLLYLFDGLSWKIVLLPLLEEKMDESIVLHFPKVLVQTNMKLGGQKFPTGVEASTV